MTVLIGGVGQLYQGDLDLGRRAVERLATIDLGPDVLVEELHYGAVAVAQRLEELSPASLVLVGAAERRRPPGTVGRRRISDIELESDIVQQAVADAVTGYVTVDLVVEVAGGLGVLPGRTVLIDAEPERTGPSEELSPLGEAALGSLVALACAEARRGPLLELADQARALLAESRLGPSAGLDALVDLLRHLDRLETDGAWGGAFRARDRLRHTITAGTTSEGMEHLDWVVWWALIEELDRIQPLEAAQELTGPAGSYPS